MEKSIIKKAFWPLIIILIIFSSESYGQWNSTEVLYANGQLNYERGNYQYASIYLFAVIQRAPKKFETDPAFKKEVTKAFDYSMNILRANLNELTKLRQLQAKAKDDTEEGSSIDALTGARPPLREPSNVKF